MPLAQQTDIGYDAYVALALEDPDRLWEWFRGRLREKPGMTARHSRFQDRLVGQLHLFLFSLFGSEFEVRANSARLRAPSGAVFIPDVAVVPTAWVDQLDESRSLETYDQPVPFVVEVWSPSTGKHDFETKFDEYRERGDREIWRIHPYERTVVAWRRQPDGSYQESLHTGGLLNLWALPQVTINLDALLR